MASRSWRHGGRNFLRGGGRHDHDRNHDLVRGGSRLVGRRRGHGQDKLQAVGQGGSAVGVPRVRPVGAIMEGSVNDGSGFGSGFGDGFGDGSGYGSGYGEETITTKTRRRT